MNYERVDRTLKGAIDYYVFIFFTNEERMNLTIMD